jgi:hypothetical protein
LAFRAGTSSDGSGTEETMTYIVIWGLISIASAIIGGVVAGMKNRDYSSWAAWCFIFPPFVIAILLTPKNSGPPPARRKLGDDGDPDRSFL